MIKHAMAALALCFAAFSAHAEDGQVDINQADAQTIAAEVKGIGPAKAEAIVKYREAHGEFETVEELANVKGIGDKTVEKIRDQVSLSDSEKP